MVVAALMPLPQWRELDWRILAHLPRAIEPRWAKDLVVVDVPSDPDLEIFRDRLSSLLVTIARGEAGIPRAVVLDVQITPEPRGLDRLEAGIRALRARGAKVYAAINPLDASTFVPTPHYMKAHAARLYDGVLDGAGHTVFDTSAGMIKYDPYLQVDARRGVSVPALAVKVAEDLFERPLTHPDRPILLSLGDSRAVDAHTLRFEGGRLRRKSAGPPAPEAALAGAIAVVGSLGEDLPVGTGRSGPEHVAWAVSARAMTADNRFEIDLLDGLPSLLVVTLLFPALAVLVARWLYQTVPRTQTSDWMILAGAAVVPTAVFVIALALLARVKLIYPRVTLPVVGILLAAVLSWWFVRRHVAARVADPASDPLGEQWDVFVSYSRTPPENEAWVRERVVKALAAAKRPNGKPVRVFFDKRALRPGESWFRRLAYAIHASRFFVPVYSSEYFTKDFCRMEMERAALRYVKDPSFIIAIARGQVALPLEYEQINYVDAAEDEEFIERVLATMREAWTRDAAASRARAGRPVAPTPAPDASGRA